MYWGNFCARIPQFLVAKDGLSASMIFTTKMSIIDLLID